MLYKSKYSLSFFFSFISWLPAPTHATRTRSTGHPVEGFYLRISVHRKNTCVLTTKNDQLAAARKSLRKVHSWTDTENEIKRMRKRDRYTEKKVSNKETNNSWPQPEKVCEKYIRGQIQRMR